MHAPDRHELNAGWTLPTSYGVDRLVLIPQEPHRLFSYWEITPVLEQNMSQLYPKAWELGRTTLRVNNVDTGVVHEIQVDMLADNWYVDAIEPDQTYYAHLGRTLTDGTFVSLVTSNMVRTPRDSLSSVIDPRWRMFAFWQQRYTRKIVGGYSSSELFTATKEPTSEGGIW
ncbi:MAG: DUF4912 domain-containing protein [Firmicutes bacterium]|nr:DUF4912 domain-containing protein [Bacillota bacterium]